MTPSILVRCVLIKYETYYSGIMGLTTFGGKLAVILDQAAFYPASGGQPCDTGTLGGVQVESVEEDASGSSVRARGAPGDFRRSGLVNH
jgi:alanyl-tRNA synthetase